MARPVPTEPCLEPSCDALRQRRGLCEKHRKAWERRHELDRCAHEGCREFIDYPALSNDGKRLTGRRIARALTLDGRPTWWCRKHEWVPYRLNDGVVHANGERLGKLLAPDKQTGCWIAKATNNDGYGILCPHGTTKHPVPAHRFAYQYFLRGTKPLEVIDHRTCRNRACAFVGHLEAVNEEVNAQRRTDKKTLPIRRKHITKEVAEFTNSYSLPLPL